MAAEGDILDLAERYGWEEINRVQEIFDALGSPESKALTEILAPFITDREFNYKAGRPPTRQQVGGATKALKDAARVLHIRLEFLRLTRDQGIKPAEARGRLAQEFGLSKIRIRQLTRLPR